MALVTRVTKWLSTVKKYKHLIIGSAICSLYFINTFIVNASINHYIRFMIKRMSPEQIVEYLASSVQSQALSVSYYSLEFAVMFWLYLSLSILIIIVHHRAIIRKLRISVANWRKLSFRLYKYLVVLLGLTICALVINRLLFPQLFGAIGDNQAVINAVVLNNPNIYIFSVVIILSPIVEEYIFRYGLINQLLKHQRGLVQVLLSALIFSFVHIGTEQLIGSAQVFLHLMLLYMPMALVYSYVYVKERNIFFPLFIHILNNIGSILIVFLLN